MKSNRSFRSAAPMWAALVIPVLWLAALLATGYEDGMTIFDLMGRFSSLLAVSYTHLVDHYGLGAGVFINGIAGNGLDFCDHNRAGDLIQNDLAVLVGHIQSIGGQFTAFSIHEPAIGVGDLELNALQRLSGYRVNLVDDKAPQLLVFDGDGLRIAAAADDNIEMCIRDS